MSPLPASQDPVPSVMNLPHVVVVPYPLQGHINPLMQLSRILATRGFLVSFVTSEHNVRLMQKAQQEHKFDGTGLDIRLMGLADGLPSGHDRSPQNPEFVLGVDNMGAAFADLVERLQQQAPPVTCIISDSFLVWTQRVANKWGISRVSFWPNSAAALACSLCVPEIIAGGCDPFLEELAGVSPITCIPGLPPLQPAQLPFKTLNGKASAQWLRTQIREQLACLEQARCIVSNSSSELESNICKALKDRLPNFYTIGPLLPSAFVVSGNAQDSGVGASLWDEDDDCMQWLDAQQPATVLYISLGSVATMSTSQIHEMAVGLAASKQPFLWVLRGVADHGIESLDISTATYRALQIQGKIIQWAPQLRVLQHRSVGGFLTHCGWNSTLESVSMGVPMIVWPQMLDQFTNCWFVVNEWKVGIQLDRSGDRISVESAVRRIMQQDEGLRMRVRMAKIKQAATESTMLSSKKNLQLLVDTILFKTEDCRQLSRDKLPACPHMK